MTDDEVKKTESQEPTPAVVVAPVAVPAAVDSTQSNEIARLKEQLKKIEETNKSISEQLARANTDIATRDVELARYRVEAENRAKDDAWKKQSARLPEANRTEEMRRLYETDKDAYLERVMELMASGKGLVVSQKAEGSVLSASTEESQTSKEDELDKLGYFFI